MTQLFRITHIQNLPFILENGLYCPNSIVQDPNFIPIGFPTLIDYRKDRKIPIEPKGTLADYIPFYFWYRSPMLYVIHKGNYSEVIKTPQNDIIYLVSSFESLKKNTCQFIFTDRHAKLEYANFYSDPHQIEQLNWELIKTEEWARKFGAERMEMKQAECLVFQHIPIDAILGIGVFDNNSFVKVKKIIKEKNINIEVKIKPNFYF